MRATCTGAGRHQLGLRRDASALARGYGYKAGPPNIVCQDKNAGDRYDGLDQVTPNTSFRIGSNTKAIAAAVLRDVLKKHLASRGIEATDDKLESLKIMDEELDLALSCFSVRP